MVIGKMFICALTHKRGVRREVPCEDRQRTGINSVIVIKNA